MCVCVCVCVSMKAVSSTVPSTVLCVCKFETKLVTRVLHKRVAPLVSAGSLHSWVSLHEDSRDLLERERERGLVSNQPYNERKKEKGKGRGRREGGRRREAGRESFCDIYLVVWRIPSWGRCRRGGGQRGAEEYCLPWGPAGIAMWRQAGERKKGEGGEDGTGKR